MPGLVNAHSHSQSALSKLAGSGDRTNVITALWYGFAHGLNRTLRDIHVSTLLHATQLLKSGCTCVIDQFRFFWAAGAGRNRASRYCLQEDWLARAGGI